MISNHGKVRIIAGEWRSRIICFPNHTDLRPTPARVRETVFNWLGQDLHGKVCLDLFAGSGALGFEAASRGAQNVVMVESNPTIASALQANIEKLKTIQINLIKMDALMFLASDRRKFDVVFLDPPYRLELLAELLSKLPSHVSNSGLVYIESERNFSPGIPWQVWRQKQAGKVLFQLLRLT